MSIGVSGYAERWYIVRCNCCLRSIFLWQQERRAERSASVSTQISLNAGRPELAPAHILAETQPRYERVRRVRDAAVERAAARLT
jgi:hypothetical protein